MRLCVDLKCKWFRQVSQIALSLPKKGNAVMASFEGGAKYHRLNACAVVASCMDRPRLSKTTLPNTLLRSVAKDLEACLDIADQQNRDDYGPRKA